MSFDNLETLSDQWRQTVETVKNELYISDTEIFEVFKATYKAFNSLHDMESVPRKACQIIMLMDEFTYYAALGDENYLGEYHPGLFLLNYALKNYFFQGNYQSGFFMDSSPSDVKKYVLDIENITLDDFILFLKDKLGKEYNIIVFPDDK